MLVITNKLTVCCNFSARSCYKKLQLVCLLVLLSWHCEFSWVDVY